MNSEDRLRKTTSLWAKSGDETGWLPLPRHMVDAACVGEYLWETWLADSLKRYISSATGLGQQDAKILVSWLAGVHDCGKATTQFQCQIEKNHAHIVEGVQEAGFPITQRLKGEKLRHELASEVILNGWLKEQGLEAAVARSIAQVAGAHHGKATDPAVVSRAEDLVDEHAEPWHNAHAELIAMITQLTGMTPELLRRIKRLHAPTQQLLTGVVIMADWIASNTEAFPMIPRGTQEERTRRGVDRIRLTAPWRPESPGDLSSHSLIDAYYRKAFDWPERFGARPIQRAVIETLAEVEGPSLIIVEAPTGEGKTETALAAAQIIADREGAQGVVFAVPTMATANGLFERVLEWAQGAAGEVASMYLGHSKSGLSEAYRNIEEDNGKADGAVVATQWLRGSKRGILSNFVVCTVDQVLMLALQAKHSMLRHLGLAGKVIIVDEVHAYDVYMGSYLHKSLQWLRHYGASVILMSATLPVEQKRDLVRAYGGDGAESTAYPLLTIVDQRGTRELPVAARPTEVHVRVELLDDAPENLIPLVAGGGCVLVVCNTIRRAQETYRLLSEHFPGEVELHHAAFMVSDRAAKEDALRVALGPRAHRGAGRPERRCVVATQVVEQSLDIDVDLLVTDIAPMDLLIQRMGRVHRHARPPEDRPEHLRQPQVFIRGVEKREPAPVFERGTAAIYDPTRLLATMAVLENRVLLEGLRRPDDIAPLVHTAYALAEVPEPWQEAWERAQATSARARERSRRRAKTYQIPAWRSAKFSNLFDRYSKQSKVHSVDEAGVAQVRDADPSIEVIPIIGGEYGYRPLNYKGAPMSDFAPPDYPLALRLACNTVRLPGRLTQQIEDFDRVITQLEEQTPVGWAESYVLKGQVALLLDENHEATINGIRLRYSHELGLEQVREEE